MNEQLLLSLMDKFDKTDVVELDLNDGNSHLILRKEAAITRAVYAATDQTHTASASNNAAAKSDAAGTTHSTAKETATSKTHLSIPASTSGNETITSPIMGTFYASPGPDAPSFVKTGTKVKAGDKLCILEAMKMMNHLEAEFDCEIVSVLASSGDMVEYGQALFEVKR